MDTLVGSVSPLKCGSTTLDGSTAYLLKQREFGLCTNSGPFSSGQRISIGASFIPNRMRTVAAYGEKAFCGTFSKDGSVFLSSSQDDKIRLYNTSHGSFTEKRCITARDVGWSVLDTAFSPDGSCVIYSSWSDFIHLVDISSKNVESHMALDLSPIERDFAIFSVAFSQDGKEILGGASDCYMYVFNRERNQRTLMMDAHEDDINSVKFADESSHILYSAGDDGVCKVWDRRILDEEDPQPVGIFAGHSDGITYIDSKGDGRYLITNSKDQTIKLWDVRKFSSSEGLEATRQAITNYRWDYRWMAVPKIVRNSRRKLKGDTSVMTYRGHNVTKTLIRCRFSPVHTTGQRYIYTGCGTGAVIIYDLLSGNMVAKLIGHKACVRDVSWHPTDVRIVSSSWDGHVSQWDYQGTDNPQDSDSDSEYGMEQSGGRLVIININGVRRRSKRLRQQDQERHKRPRPEET
ncbi:PREDICTED: DDB1- and CUL4-associated factor 11-like [Branchiostoma belcheri]|uniref:DDB1- and CUL4-associated factor 11-like n=1 Tax=Branchiostoma belcheri TaxID=7741 RepID=A0A6P4Z780_BRABE|nr:PREDICTED: DDB1- and CUL4-associated factor 11-like [Branchiostoma belcheri]